MKKALYILLQCTWGLTLTLIGLVLFIILRNNEHQFYHGSIDTKWNARSGISLGLFIFTPSDDIKDSELIRVHEYGHTIQNLVLGPLMIIVGIISLVWANTPYFRRMRKERSLPYTSCFVESWASKWGEMVLKQPAIWD